MNAKAAALLQAFENLGAGATVVEIGCVRFAQEIPSDGWSTVHLATAAADHGWKLHSVDVDPQAVEIACNATADLPGEVHLADGAEWLAAFAGPIDGLFLDGSADPAEAVAQYQAARLADRAVIVVDDVQPIGQQAWGKGDLLLDALERDGFTVEVVDTEPGYRMAIARP